MHVNPVLGRELRERMRGPRAFVALTVYLCILVLAVVISYKGNSELNSFDAAFDLGRRTAIGRQVLEWVLLVMLVLVLFLVPGFTAGAVAGERERQTLVPLQVTLLRPRSILWGKVSAALAFIALLVVAAAPLLAVAFLLGGISVGQAIAGLFGVLVVALVLALIVVGISAMVRRVQAATVVSYAVTFLLAIASFVVYGVAGLVTADEVGENEPPGWLLVPNPIVLVADLAAGNGVGDGPLDSISETVRDAQDQEQDVFGGGGDDGGAVFEGDVAVAPPGVEPDGDGDAVWPWSLLSLSVLAAMFFVAGVRRLRTPAEAER